MTNRRSKLRAVDFFCGGGGMSLGMSKAGIEIIAGIDNDPACRATYTANHPGSKFISEDITKYKDKDLGKATGISRSDDNMIFIGCSPCQYWSIINGKSDSVRKKPARKSRSLLRDFLRFVDHYRPGFVVIENVRGIERNSKKSGLSDLLDFFDEAGYKPDFAVLAANKFGVPQTRRRFVLIASRVLKTISLPQPDGEITTVQDAIGGEKRLPSIKAGECDANDKLHKSAGLSETNIERLKLTPQGCGRDGWYDRDDLQIDAYRGKPKTFFRENYGRMAWHQSAPTITTKFYSIGCGKFSHPEEHRAISLREGALLQTFPEDYRFETSDFSKTARIIGNAVPPELARRIGEAITKQWRTSLTKKRAHG